MPLRLPAYQPIPAPDRGTDLIEVSAAQLQPTQWCVGLAEIWSREKDFAQDTRQQRLGLQKYLVSLLMLTMLF